MAIDIRQSLKLTQQLLMTPQLQQAIKLLQLSRFELEQFVSTQLAENPVLEEGFIESAEEQIHTERELESTAAQAFTDGINEVMGEPPQRAEDRERGAEDFGSETSETVPAQDLAWEAMSRFNEEHSKVSSKSQSSSDDFPNYENIITKGKSLVDILKDQIIELDLDENERRAADLLIGNLDERGYLSGSLEDIAEQESLALDVLEDILDTIQRLDPPGVGARDLKECLLIQIRQRSLKNGIIEKIVEHHLKDLEVRNLAVIAKTLSIPLKQVVENVEKLLDLEPIPGRSYSNEMAQIVIPDVYVFKMAGEWVVSLNEDGLPKLRVSEIYSNKNESRVNSDKDKAYIQEKLKSAQWLITSIEKRQKTIYKVAEAIVEKQIDFFEKGSEFLRPMILRDIADAIEMHESSVSRVTTNKYIHTPRGIFELKYFFSSSVSKSDGTDLASESVKQMLADLVKNEDHAKPFSDQKLVELLQEKGVELARRTVAKYREQLNILPSSRRKKLI